MRNPIQVLRSLDQKTRTIGYKFDRIYRNLYNPEFYWMAYRNIAKSQGSMTIGMDGMTVDDMTEARITRIINSLKSHTYQPHPARRTYIPKKSDPTKKRPLGIPSADDKLVQEVIRMILEAIYEPTFSKHSHGFRPQKSCHTALGYIQHNFTGVRWIIEGDIKACFDSFDHHTLIRILRKRINDEQFLQLMWKFLKAGYMEQWEYHATYSGTPQGSGMSPILANIYMTELDSFMEAFMEKYNRQPERTIPSHEYNVANGKYARTKSKLAALSCGDDRTQLVIELKKAQQARAQIHYYNQTQNGQLKIVYNRYADDFVIGVIGPKADAEQIKEKVKEYLHQELYLTLSEEKTVITHSSKLVRYLGYDLCVSRNRDLSRDKNGVLKRSRYGNVRLYLPHEKWFNKLLEYGALKIVKDLVSQKDVWKPLHRGQLQNKDDVEIIRKYNSETRGLYNFYRLACNVSALNHFDFIMNGSLHKTLAFKYKTTANEIRKRYTKDGIFGVDYETRHGTKRCDVFHDGFRQVKAPLMDDIDTLPPFRKYDRVNSLASRIKLGICELCGASQCDIHMHHVRSLKGLKPLPLSHWRKVSQLALSSFIPSAAPITSRYPSSLTPMATRMLTFSNSPPQFLLR